MRYTPIMSIHETQECQVLDDNRNYLILWVAMAEASGDRLTNGMAVASIGDASAQVTKRVTIELNRRATEVPYRAGNTLLQTARSVGLSPPSSCETGSCATCMARIVDGSVRIGGSHLGQGPRCVIIVGDGECNGRPASA